MRSQFQRRNPFALTAKFGFDAAQHPQHLVHLPAEVFVFQTGDIEVLAGHGIAAAFVFPSLGHTLNQSKKRARADSAVSSIPPAWELEPTEARAGGSVQMYRYNSLNN
jgi:hypothetical protein